MGVTDDYCCRGECCGPGSWCCSHAGPHNHPHLSIKPLVAWYDLWIGVFVDRPKRRLYIFPLPCLGVVIGWSEGASVRGVTS